MCHSVRGGGEQEYLIDSSSCSGCTHTVLEDRKRNLEQAAQLLVSCDSFALPRVTVVVCFIATQNQCGPI